MKPYNNTLQYHVTHFFVLDTLKISYYTVLVSTVVYILANIAKRRF